MPISIRLGNLFAGLEIIMSAGKSKEKEDESPASEFAGKAGNKGEQYLKFPNYVVKYFVRNEF